MPFGETLYEEHSNTRDMPYKFNGKEKDEETGLYYYGARYYDPYEGRFLSVDPMWTKYLSIGSYNYCLGNPIRLIDPTGMIVDEASMSEQTKKDIEIARKNPKFEERYQKLVESKHTYTFNYQEADNITNGNGDKVNNAHGVFTTDGDKLMINYSYKRSVEQGELSTLFHETEHARQFEDGELGFDKNKNGKWVPNFTYDITDEVKAQKFGAQAPGGKAELNKKWDDLETGIDYLNKFSDKYLIPTQRWNAAGKPEEGINSPYIENKKSENRFINKKK